MRAPVPRADQDREFAELGLKRAVEAQKLAQPLRAPRQFGIAQPGNHRRGHLAAFARDDLGHDFGLSRTQRLGHLEARCGLAVLFHGGHRPDNPRIARASSGVATSLPISRTIRAARATMWALPSANTPLAI